MRKIHITESQLKQVLLALNEGNIGTTNIDITDATAARNGNVKAAWDDVKRNNPAIANNEKTTATIDPDSLQEGFEEANNWHTPYGKRPELGDLDYDYSSEEGYDELLQLLRDLSMDNRDNYLLYNALETGRNEDVHELLDTYIANVCDFKVSPNMLRQALEEFRAEEDEKQNSYSNVMECYTKKQIKEARLRKAMNNCGVVLRKKDIKK